MHICIISGSARKDNNTIRVAYALKRILEKEHEVSVIDFVNYDIPLLPQGDVHIDTLTSFQSQLMTKMTEADIVILISPEYNWSTTPEILNMLHRFGDTMFSSMFAHKIFAMV